ncbi:serine-rich adhesin for platelets-like isoform X25 [Portunus trituberculatus]|uniref:serine-rich adhesin for platelets-like isoform X25 n=1 Tax=Portunus trituberculatus TaxID=210409 RepID=UPI001E1CC7FD|nr:serine-rich adhesin for platelets-like isoform X25 [Portunus trituberculatus]
MLCCRLEWVEIIEPSTRNIMFANLTTGQCVWDPPPGAHVKKFDDNQWWELFDTNTSRFYYYNATSQKTVWHRPQNCDIIPLAKLQLFSQQQIKQNTEVADDDDGRKVVKESIGTQTPAKLQIPFTIPAGTSSPKQQQQQAQHSSPAPHHLRLKTNGSLPLSTTTTTTSSTSSTTTSIPPHKNGVLQAAVPSMASTPHHPKLSPSSSLSSSRSSLSGVPGPGSLQRCHSAFLGRRGPRGSLPGISSSSGAEEVLDCGVGGGAGRRGGRLRWSGRAVPHSRGGPGPGSLQKKEPSGLTDGLSLPHSLARRVTSSNTQTSSAPSPRPVRRPSAPTTSPSGGSGGGSGSRGGSGGSTPGHHHHHHHRHTGSCSHHHHHHHHHPEATNGEAGGRRMRRSSQSSQGSSLSYTRPYKQESGRSSDSSMSQSRTSLESSGYRLLESPRGSARDAKLALAGNSRVGERRSKEGDPASSPRSPDSMSSQSSPTHPQGAPGTPSSHRRPHPDRREPASRYKAAPQHDFALLQMAKQRSFDVSNYPKRSELNLDRPREIALSRSYSFMSRPRCHDEDGMHERFLVASSGGGSGSGGLRSVESTPQPRRRNKHDVAGSPDSSLGSHGYLSHRQRSDSSGLESLATPMMHRKQRSLESGKTRLRADLRPSSSAHTRLVASDSSPSPPSPKHEFSPFTFESPKGQDSGASTLTDKDTRSNYGRGSADSSPHSQVDSGLVSGTTGSRGSIDSNSRRTERPDKETKHSSTEATAKVSPSRPASEREGRRCSHRRHHHCSKHRTGNSAPAPGSGCGAPASTTTAPSGTTDSDRSDTLQSSSSSQHLVQASSGTNSHNHNSSSGSSSTAKQASPSSSSKQASPSTAGTGRQTSPSTTNTTSTTTTTTTTTTTAAAPGRQTSPQHHDLTHLYSNLEYVYEQPVYQYIMEQAKLTGYRFGDALFEDGDSLHSDDSAGRLDDSDEFADDEGMSNADSSSQEYLEDVNYLADDEMYSDFYMPFSWRNKTKLDEDDTVDGTKESQAPSAVHSGPGITAPSPQVAPRTSLPCTIPSAASHAPMPPNSLPLDTQHASLRRKQDASNHQPLYSPILEKGELSGGGGGTGSGGGQLGNRPLSISIPNMTDPTLTTNPVTGSLHRPSQGLTALSLMKKPPSESDFERYSGGGGGEGHNMEKYAQENLNIHTRGLLRKKVPVVDMISWTKDLIRKPMLATLDKSLKNQACDLFRLVQIYMSDRKPKPGMTLNSVGLDLVSTCFNTEDLRDELFVQICRQTTENHKRDSLRRGWELLAICLAFFPPSDKFNPYLAGYISRHCDPAFCSMFPDVSKWPIHIQVAHYAGVCMKRLERTTVNGKRQRLKKPTLEEIDLARLHIFRASMFGSTIEEVMALQRDRYPHRRLPWVQTTLSEEVLRLQGTNTEGIFRVPADFEEVHQLKQVVDQWEVGDCGEAHVCAALLKLWYRELYEPLIPDSLYQAAINAHEDPQQAVALVNNLPEINRLVLSYLIRFLQYFAQPEIVAATKMDASNLAMVMAPNCLRCTSDDPRIIYENTRKEMAFIRTLIQNLDTAFMEGVV